MSEVRTQKLAVVATLGEALGEGFTPDGESLKNPSDGNKTAIRILKEFGGRVVNVEVTGNTDYPALLNGSVILPDALVNMETKYTEYDGSAGHKDSLAQLEDGSLIHNGVLIPASAISALSKAVKANDGE